MYFKELPCGYICILFPFSFIFEGVYQIWHINKYLYESKLKWRHSIYTWSHCIIHYGSYYTIKRSLFHFLKCSPFLWYERKLWEKQAFEELFTNIAFKLIIVPNEWSCETLMDSQLLAMVTLLSSIKALHNSFVFFLIIFMWMEIQILFFEVS